MFSNITHEEFTELFPRDPDLWELMTTRPASFNELVERYLPSKLWRMDNLYRIIDKAGDDIPFTLNRAQLRVYAKSIEHSRLIILKSRQQGISTFWLISYFDDVITQANLNCGLMAQGKDESGTLLERLKHCWNTLDPWVKEFFCLRILKDNSAEFKLSNQSTMFIRTSFRSATLQRLHISELGKIANKYPERAKETKTGTLQALAPGNTGAIESTAEGVNMFKHMWDASVVQYEAGRLSGKDFLPIFLSWLDDPDCVEFVRQYPTEEEEQYFTRLELELKRVITLEQRNFWISQHRELEGDIHQEYPATPEEAFTAAQDGTYWAKRYIECIIRGGHKMPMRELYDPNLPVYCVSDIGRSDYMVLAFIQVWNGQIRIIGEYYNSGEWLGHYVKKLEEIAEENNWDVVEWFLPHDAEVKDISQQDDMTREEVIQGEGFMNTTVLDKTGLMEGIEGVRKKFEIIYIASECDYLEQCCLNYTKEWNPLLEIWRDAPKKSQWNHGADTIRYIVQAASFHLDAFRDKSVPRPLHVVDGIAV